MLTKDQLLHTALLAGLCFHTGASVYAAVFAKLMWTLYVDREPHEIFSPVQKSRIPPTIALDSLGLPPAKYINPYEGTKVEPPPAGFPDLKEALFDAIESPVEISSGDTNLTEFFIDVLTLIKGMMQFGLFDGSFNTAGHSTGILKLGDESKRVATALLRLLEGRPPVRAAGSDRSKLGKITQERTLEVIDVEVQGGVEVEVRNGGSRFTMNQGNVLLMEMKVKAIEIIEVLFGMRATMRITLLLDHVFPAQVQLDDVTFNPLFGTGKKAETIQQDHAAEFESGSYTKDARDKAMAVRVFEGGGTAGTESQEELLCGMLLDILQYNDDEGLCFGAFQTLIGLVAQDLFFCQTLQQVTILGTSEKASSFFGISAQITEFRRLRKWLHQEQECRQCIDVARSLLVMCKDELGLNATAQNLMRDLLLHDYIMRVLKMRLNKPWFPEMIRACLELTETFCDRNSRNQEIIAPDIDDVLLPLLFYSETRGGELPYVQQAARCLMAIVDENETLCVRYASLLVQKVSQLAKTSPRNGRHVDLLRLLQRLLTADGHTIVQSQVAVCKGAVTAKELIDPKGDLRAGEWGSGPKLQRMEAFHAAIAGDARCEQHARYYANCLRVLGVCARGKIPTTELLCASVIPFTDAVCRLHELLCPDIVSQDLDKEDTVLMLKCSTLLYFREVFVDTNSEHIIRSLRRQRNGVLALDPRNHADNSTPLLASLANELRRLGDTSQLSDLCREYLFEQVVLFFIQYARVVPLSSVGVGEEDACTLAFKQAAAVASDAAENPEYSSREVKMLKTLVDVSIKHARGDGADKMPVMYSDNNDGANDVSRAASAAELRWSAFSNVYRDFSPVDELHGTDRVVGIGILTLARKLWQINPCHEATSEMPYQGKDTRYSAYLVPPLRKLLAKMTANHPTKEDITTALSIIDTIRAIPYVAVVYSEREDDLKEAFRRYTQVEDLKGKQHPDLMKAQLSLVSQGWALLAWEFLSVPKLRKLHLPMLRLLLAMTGGCSSEVQDEMFRQLNDLTICPKEIMALSCRRLIRLSIDDLKAQRKALARAELEKQRASETFESEDGKKKEKKTKGAGVPKHRLKAKALAVAVAAVVRVDDNQELTEQGHALEVLKVMDNCCGFNHKPFQQYISSQSNHEDTYDLISDVVLFVNHIERDLKTVVQNSDDTEAANMHLFHARSRKTLQRASIAFKLLKDLASGPNVENQRTISQTDIISVVNRILAVSTYTVRTEREDKEEEEGSKGKPEVDVAQTGRHSVWQDLAERDPAVSPSKPINSMVCTFLLALLEGQQKKDLVRRLLTSVEWKHVDSHLQALKFVMSLADEHPGRVKRRARTALEEEVARMRKQVEVVGGSMPPLMSAADEEHELEFRFREMQEQLRQEACWFITIVAKLASFRFPGADGDAMRAPIQRMTSDQQLMRYYLDRLGEVEVVRTETDELERLYFLMPQEHMVKNIDKAFEHNVTLILNGASRSNNKEKLSALLEGLVQEVRVMQTRNIDDSWKRPTLAMVWMATERQDPKLYLSILLSFICMVALDANSDLATMDSTTYARAPELYIWAVLLGLLHAVVSCVSFFAFVRVRVPVLREMALRHSKLELLQSGQGDLTPAQQSAFQSYTVFISGLRPDIRIEDIRPSMRNYGVVAAMFSPPDSSWALVSFATSEGASKAESSINKTNACNEFCEEDDEGNPQGRAIASKLDSRGCKFDISTRLNSQVARDMLLEIDSQDFSTTYRVVTAVQRVLDAVRLGDILPVQSLYLLRGDATIWENFLDIGFSLAGLLWSPILFSFHVNKLRKLPAAKIVVDSIVKNVNRLLTTIVLALFMIYLFALVGLLQFFDAHTDANVANQGWIDGNSTVEEGKAAGGDPGGPCGNLMSCFVSYTFAGFVQQGLTYWLVPVKFPETASDLSTNESGRILFEVLFMVVTSSFVISIITGIICDTYDTLLLALTFFCASSLGLTWVWPQLRRAAHRAGRGTELPRLELLRDRNLLRCAPHQTAPHQHFPPCILASAPRVVCLVQARSRKRNPLPTCSTRTWCCTSTGSLSTSGAPQTRVGVAEGLSETLAET